MKIRFTLFMLILISSLNLYGQIHIYSPYSRFGLGEMFFATNTASSAMAGTSIALRNKFILNYNNPASLSVFERQTFVFDAGFYFYPKILKTTNKRENSFYANISNLSMAFSIAKRMGLSVSLYPLSSVGYNIKTQDSVALIGKVEHTYEGWGGLNDFNVSYGLGLWKNLSIGIKMHYIFGSINRKQIAVFDTAFTKVNTRITHNYNVKGINFSVGSQYELNFRKKDSEKQPYKVVFGVVAENKKDLKAINNILAVTFFGTNIFSPNRDTIYQIINDNSKITFPFWLSSGFFIEQTDRWSLGADFSTQRWSDFRIGNTEDSLKDNFRLSLGGSIMPKTKMVRKNLYLFGIHYYRWPLKIHGRMIDQFGMSFGLVYPVRKSRITMQFSFEIGKVGTTKQYLVEELYGKFKLNVHFIEKMFFKRKYN